MKKNETIGLSSVLGFTKHEMRQQMDIRLAALGITSAQYTALAILERKKTMSNAELARACYVTPQTMVRITEGLKKLKLVKTLPDASNRKRIRISLTKSAETILCQAHLEVNELEKEMLESFSKEEVAQFLDFLKRAFNNLRFI